MKRRTFNLLGILAFLLFALVGDAGVAGAQGGQDFEYYKDHGNKNKAWNDAVQKGFEEGRTTRKSTIFWLGKRKTQAFPTPPKCT